MIGLTGNYEVKVDSKGRLRLPTNLLQQIGETEDSQYVLNKGMGKCLRLFPKKQWTQITQEMSKLSYFQNKERDFLRYFYQIGNNRRCWKRNNNGTTRSYGRPVYTNRPCISICRIVRTSNLDR